MDGMLEGIMLSEISHTEKDIMFICGICKTKQTSKYKKKKEKRSRLVGLENKLVLTSDGGGDTIRVGE